MATSCASDLPRWIEGSNLQNQPLRIFEVFLDSNEKGHGLLAVDNAMVVAERKIHHRTRHNLAVNTSFASAIALAFTLVAAAGVAVVTAAFAGTVAVKVAAATLHVLVVINILLMAISAAAVFADVTLLRMVAVNVGRANTTLS